MLAKAPLEKAKASLAFLNGALITLVSHASPFSPIH